MSGVLWNVDAAKLGFEKVIAEMREVFYFYKSEGCSVSKLDSPCLALGIYSVGVCRSRLPLSPF